MSKSKKQVQINGVTVTPRYSIGALEDYFDLTGDDLMTEGANLNTPKKRIAFVFVGLKHATDELDVTIDMIRDQDASWMISVAGACLYNFTGSFGIDEDQIAEAVDQIKEQSELTEESKNA